MSQHLIYTGKTGMKRIVLQFIFPAILLASLCILSKCRAQVTSKIFNSSFVANKKELTWLKDNCIKIKTIQAGSGFDDLQPIQKFIGKARIVGLGENTHGTSEVFRIKHRLVEFLASEMGFKMLSVESLGMPEARKMNDYVLNGIGNPKDLLKEFDLWTFNNQEFLDLIEWMRNFNASGKGKIQFTGFDISALNSVLEAVRNFAQDNDRTLKTKIDSVSEMFQDLKPITGQQMNITAVRNIHDKCESVFLYISKNINSIKGIRDEDQRKWLLNYARILVQSTDPEGITDYYVYRDKCMADNIGWLTENYPNEKIILWAHIGHLRKEKLFLGGYLSEKFGQDYYSIGTASNSGKYTAVGSNGLSSENILLESRPGSFEYSFHKTQIPDFYLDFSQVKQDATESVWLNDSLNYRGIGANATNDQFNTLRISRWFNAIVFIDSTHASNVLN
jgi:erythromycin esterase